MSLHLVGSYFYVNFELKCELTFLIIVKFILV